MLEAEASLFPMASAVSIPDHTVQQSITDLLLPAQHQPGQHPREVLGSVPLATRASQAGPAPAATSEDFSDEEFASSPHLARADVAAQDQEVSRSLLLFEQDDLRS